MTQLPLFPNLVISLPRNRPAPRRRVAPSHCEIVPFPLCRRVRVVRQIAEGLESRSGKFRDGFWYDAVAALEDQLSAAGISNDEIILQIRHFRTAVGFEIEMMFDGGRRGGGDAA